MTASAEGTTIDNGEKKTKQAIKALVESLEENMNHESEHSFSCQPFLQIFHPVKRSDMIVPGHTPKQQQSLIFETLKSMHKNHARRFFSALGTVLQRIILDEMYVPASAFEGGSDKDENETITDKKSAECLHFMKYAAICVSLFVEGRLDQTKGRRQSVGLQLQILPEVFDVALELHNILLSLHSCGPESIDTQNAVLSMCESWWFANAGNRDALIAQCLPLLVVQTLDGREFQKSRMTRLCKLRDAFQVIDFANPSSDSLRHLLLRISSNPLCIRMPEGRKFLASLFRDIDLLKDLHMSIRAQIPNARATVLKSYGEIYHKAWKDTSDTPDIRDEIEHHVLQDLMYGVIHVASPGTANSLMKVLEPLHDDKKTKEVSLLLYRSYGPILWRSLTAANPLVRKNAVMILERVFPLHDPSQNNMKEAMSKATSALKKALQDKDPRVRVAGCEATAKICALFWDALPAAEIRMLLNHIILELASDGSSSAVRASALDATTTLLNANQSHAVLRGLLPCLGNMIHDKAEKVRLAACRMLIQVKKTPGIKFYHVVPVDHLIARLSEEWRLNNSPCNMVALEITSLLLNSYFPQGRNASASLQIQRTMAFLMTDPRAASVFYSNLANLLGVEAIVKFTSMLLACLQTAVERDQAQEVRDTQAGKKRRRRSTNNTTENRNEKQNLSASNLPLMASLTETIAILLESIAPLLADDKYESSRDQITARFVEVHIADIFAHFERKCVENEDSGDRSKTARNNCYHACASILRCIKTFPADTIRGITTFISESLENTLNNNVFSLEMVLSHLSLVCSWGLVDDVANSLGYSIECAFGQDGISLLSPSFDLGKTRGGRSSLADSRDDGKIEIPTFSPRTLSLLIDQIMKGDNALTTSIRESIMRSPSASLTIETALGQAPIFAERLLVADSAIGRNFKESEVEFVIWACEAYGRFALHREAQRNNEMGLNHQVKMLLAWSKEKVIPALIGARSEESQLRDLDLSRISNVSDSLIMPESPSLESPPRQRANLSRTPDMARKNFARLENSPSSDPAVFVVSAAARALLQSSCIIFAELLAVGGSCGDEISKSAVEWLGMFQHTAYNEDRSKVIHDDILPSFVRLAIILCKSSSSSFLLLEEIFKCIEGGIGGQSQLLTRCVNSLLKDRSNQSSKMVDGVINAFLNAVDSVLETSKACAFVEPIDSLQDVWENPDGCILPILKEISSLRGASLLLVKKIVAKIGTFPEKVSAQSVFYMRCLSYYTARQDLGGACLAIINDSDIRSVEKLSGTGDMLKIILDTFG